MDSTTLEDRIIATIAKQAKINEAQVTPDTNVHTDLGLDSLDQANVLFALEDELGIYLSFEEGIQCNTVQGYIDLVKSAQTSRV